MILHLLITYFKVLKMYLNKTLIVYDLKINSSLSIRNNINNLKIYMQNIC